MPPGPRRSRQPFCFCPNRAPVPSRHAVRCIRTRGHGPVRWRRQRDIPALWASATATTPATRPSDFQCRRYHAQFAEIAALNSRRMNPRAASKPPSRNIAPSRDSNASASAEARSRPPFVSSPRLRIKCAPSPSARACSASVRRLTSLARALVRGPSSKAGNLSYNFVRQHELQHRVAEKFQPLIVRRRPPLSCATDGCVSASRNRSSSRNV